MFKEVHHGIIYSLCTENVFCFIQFEGGGPVKLYVEAWPRGFPCQKGFLFRNLRTID